MSAIYDNWERLIAAVLKREQFWQLCHAPSRTPSIRSEASDFSSSFNLSSPLRDVAFGFSLPGSSSKPQRSLPNLVLISDFSPAFDVKDLHLASAEFLGSGTFGSAYTAAMDNEVRIVVKRLKFVKVSELEFKRYMEIVGSVRHENVAALRAYYSVEGERLVLYDYYSQGSVYALLHGQTDEDRAHVDWETRLKIAIGAARGIAEIHTQHGGKLFHGNIKASNVFLNPKQYGCVSDLGMAKVIETTFMPTARCYAPEVKNTQNISQASDVYSFGILLLELLTRKSTAHIPGGPEAVDLVKLVNSVKNKKRAAKVFDADLLKHPTVREEMVKMLEIGLRCVAKSMKKRPKMSEVVKSLEDISKTKPISRDPLEGKIVFLDNSIAPFDLYDMLRTSAEALGRGTFGYWAILENGNIIAVKTLKYVDVTLKEFRQHMEVIGRIRHTNVAELKAYSFSSKDKLVVYDYYKQDSLSALLHGQTGAGRKLLDWETRLKVAVTAARGMDHIHKQDGGKLVHGNMNSSNILIDKQKYSIICETGLAKVMNPIRMSSMQNPGYRAPEVTDTKKLSQASDVYSFGVVLLELVSGWPSQITTDNGEVISLVKWIPSVVHDGWTEVFDVELLRHTNANEEMILLLQIAVDCVNVVPGRRPTMSEVVKVLEEISGIGLPDEPRLEDKWGLPTIESRLEDVLEDLLSRLTR